MKKEEEKEISASPEIAKTSSSRFAPPEIETVKFQAVKIGLPESEALKFFHFYESKGWKVGKSPMKSWVSAMAGWKTRFDSDGTRYNGRGDVSISDEEAKRQKEINYLRQDIPMMIGSHREKAVARLKELEAQND